LSHGFDHFPAFAFVEVHRQLAEGELPLADRDDTEDADDKRRVFGRFQITQSQLDQFAPGSLIGILQAGR
jgi:hypothetical protein